MALVVELQREGKLRNAAASLTVENTATASVLIQALSQAASISESRVRLSVALDKPVGASTKSKKYVLKPNDQLSEFARENRVVVFARDLGPQIAWRTVFLIEYLGPILIHPIFYSWGQKAIYGHQFAHTDAQKLVYYMILAHFAKRELETMFVHKFSLATMPLFNLFKNCLHYWLLSGVLIAYFLYAPSSWHSSILFCSSFIKWTSAQQKLLVAVWTLAELANFLVHLNLASLRSPGSIERKIPHGFGFDKVSCPNYFFEAWGWVLVSILGQNWSIWLFTLVGALQMYIWAVKKHRRYLAEFPDYPKDRKAFIPYIC